MAVKIAAIVVTHNRKVLLRRCLDALFSQIRPPDTVYVIDNASTDGTDAFLAEYGYATRPDLVYRALPENLGGSGGFHVGLEAVMAEGFEWAWMMDDDAEPEPDALAAMEESGLDPGCCYGSCAVFEEREGELWLCWPAVSDTSEISAPRRIRKYSELPATMRAVGIPFLGFMISKRLVERAGLPDLDYFLSGDDMDYGERIKKSGANLVLVKASRIRHPRPEDYAIRFMGFNFFCLRMPPWRRYYDIRNRVSNGRRHYGIRLLFMTLPGVLVRWVATMRYEPARLRQSVAYVRGITDGLLGRLGRRWEPGA